MTTFTVTANDGFQHETYSLTMALFTAAEIMNLVTTTELRIRRVREDGTSTEVDLGGLLN